MSTGSQGEVDDFEQDQAETLPLTKIVTKLARAVWKLFHGWRPPAREED
jgi:hypothetical protein